VFRTPHTYRYQYIVMATYEAQPPVWCDPFDDARSVPVGTTLK
jgi:hypothetical protein